MVYFGLLQLARTAFTGWKGSNESGCGVVSMINVDWWVVIEMSAA